jgi:hypothetical protein
MTRFIYSLSSFRKTERVEEKGKGIGFKVDAHESKIKLFVDNINWENDYKEAKK